MTDMGYEQATRNFLNQVLSSLMTTGRLTNDIAQRIYSTQEQWIPQFIRIFNNQPVSTQDFQNALANFVLSMCSRQAPAAPTWNGGGSWGGGSWGGGSWGPPAMPFSPEPTRGFDMGSYFNNAPARTAPVFGNAPVSVYDDVNKPSSIFRPPASDHMKESAIIKNQPVFQPYDAPWIENKDNRISNTKSGGDYTIEESIYEGDQREDGLTVLSIKTEDCLSSKYRIMELVNAVSGGARRYFASISHKKPIVVYLPKEEMVKHLEAVKELLSSKQSAESQLKLFYEYIRKAPYEVFSTFERIYLDEFNQYLKAKVLNSTKNFSLSVSVEKMDVLMNFLPDRSPVILDKLTKHQDYQSTLMHVLARIHSYIGSLQVSEDKDTWSQAMLSQTGMESALMYSMIKQNKENEWDSISSKMCVLVRTTKTIVTNLPVEKSAGIVELLSTEKPVLVQSNTTVLDVLLRRTNTSGKCVQVIVEGGKPMCVGWTSDMRMVYSLA